VIVLEIFVTLYLNFRNGISIIDYDCLLNMLEFLHAGLFCFVTISSLLNIKYLFGIFLSFYVCYAFLLLYKFRNIEISNVIITSQLAFLVTCNLSDMLLNMFFFWFGSPGVVFSKVTVTLVKLMNRITVCFFSFFLNFFFIHISTNVLKE